MMKWEQYKILTPEEQKEYDFRFKSKIDNSPKASLDSLVMLWALYSTVTAIILVILKEYVAVSSSAMDFFILANKVTVVMAGAWFLFTIAEWVSFYFANWKAHKWYKEKTGKKL